MIAGALIAGSLALVIGSISLRMRGPFFTLLTIAFAEVVRLISIYWKHLTNGSEGVIIELKPGLMNLHFLEKWPYSSSPASMRLLWAACAPQSAVRELDISSWRSGTRGRGTIAWCSGVSATRGCNRDQRRLYRCRRFTVGDVHPVHRPGQHDVVPTVGRGRLDYHCRRTGHPWGPLFGTISIVPLERVLRSLFGGVLFGLHGVIFGLVLIVILLAMPDGLLNGAHRLREHRKVRSRSRDRGHQQAVWRIVGTFRREFRSRCRHIPRPYRAEWRR